MSNNTALSNNDTDSNENYVCVYCRKTPSDEPDYYWRDYPGVIPHDAIPGGHDIANRTTYIGQAFYSKAGILPGTIYSDNSTIRVPHRGQHLVETGIKILCSPNKSYFKWEDAESSNLHIKTIGKHLVYGGCENGKLLNIGRVRYQGELTVGKVLGYNAGNARMYFVHKNKEISVQSYQVLIYKK